MSYFLKQRTLLTKDTEKTVVNENARRQLFKSSVTKFSQEVFRKRTTIYNNVTTYNYYIR